MMARNHVDSIDVSDGDEDETRVAPPPSGRSRKPISPPSLGRAHAADSIAHRPLPTHLAATKGTTTKHMGQDTKNSTLPVRSSAAKPPQDHAAASQQQPAVQRTPKTQTPKRTDWTVDKLESKLRQLSVEIGTDHADLTNRLIHDAWRRGAPEQKHTSKKDWFAGIKLEPVESTAKRADTMRIRTKQVGQGRSAKQEKEKREYFPVICIKTNREPTPRYSFHHVEIRKNILSPNTMLTYVPHLRDLADNEEGVYRRWLESLEVMDKTSGFATLSRHEKVVKTIQKERAVTLLEYIDIWLPKLGIENLTKATLIRHTATQSDAVTPQQKSSILNSYNDDGASPRSAKPARMFTEAFDRIFNHKSLNEQAVPLRDVLLLDKSVDTIVDSKKMKDTPSQAKTAEADMSVETFLETYSLLGCLICTSHSCEHGEYGVDNERKRFSVEVVGGLSPMIRRQLAERFKRGDDDRPSSQRGTRPCSEDCYLRGRPGTRARQWSETETMLLKSFHLVFQGTSIPVACSTAVATGRPCWDVSRQIDKMDLSLPSVKDHPQAQVKPVPWYDRKRKMLIGDWQEQTNTHEHSRKDHFDPCHHDGPCDRNCPCVQNHIMCERFCRCTDKTCASKFTGCACHANGKTCMSRQKDRPCICVQLNRECDPALCGGCGVLERTMSQNADDDALHATGCQNCSLQRGKSKSLVLGRSKVAGYGLYTTEDIGSDEFVIEYVGELISQDEGVRREARRGDVFDESSNSSYLFTLLEQEGIWVDAAIYGNLSRYINHQESNCNVTPRIMYVNGEYRIKFTSLREIKAGEELFFHYGENFPNLTKKLLDEERAEKKRRKAKEQERLPNGEKVRKKPGPKPGKKTGKKRGRKPGPKPKKKMFAALESEWESEDAAGEKETSEGPFREPPARPLRKRKRQNDTNSDSGDYQPRFFGSHEDTQSGTASGLASRGQSRPGRGHTKRKRTAKGTFAPRDWEGELADDDEDIKEEPGPSNPPRSVQTGDDAALPADGGEDSEAQPIPLVTPKRRGRKPKHVKEAEAQQEAALLDSGGRSSIQNSSRYSHTEARLELDSESHAEETPSRPRTRRKTRELAENSPLSTPNGPRFQARETREEISDSEEPTSRTSRRSRRKKSGTADDEYTGESWTDSDGVAHYGGREDSDDSMPVQRRRRRPARYED